MLPSDLHSPVDLMRLAGVEPPSPAIETILDAAYGCKPTTAQRAIWRTVSKQSWPSKRPRRVVACIGRRGLKTSGIASWLLVYEALFGVHEEHALEGTRVYFAVIAPRAKTAREATIAIRAVLDALDSLGIEYAMRDAQGAPEIVLTSPASRCEKVITILTADEVSGRGFAIAVAVWDEAGHLPSEQWLTIRDREIVRAVRAAQIQFPNALEVFCSTPGKPGSLFHELVTKPPKDALLVRAASWVTNPRITKAKCLAEAAGDSVAFEQEFAVTRFGYSGQNFFDSGAVWRCLGSAHVGKGPRPGFFLVGFDHGQRQDAAAIVVVSAFDAAISASNAPVRHVVVEHAESIPSSRKSPLPTSVLVDRLAAVSKSYRYAPCVFDAHSATDVSNELKKRGYRAFEDIATARDIATTKVPSSRSFLQVPMHPAAQTPRWRSLRDLVHGRRLHLGAGDEDLARELAALTATEQSSGALKVEGKRDNMADALALTIPFALRMAATDGPGGVAEFKLDGVSWTPEGGLQLRNGRWVTRLPNGRVVPAEVPRWHPTFDAYARDMLAQGVSTPAIESWLEEQRAQGRGPGDGEALPPRDMSDLLVANKG